MTAAIPLKGPEGNVMAWACSTCGRAFWTVPGEIYATDCCCCSECQKPIDRVKQPHSSMHDECWRARDRRINAERIEKAVVVTDHDGWLYVDGLGHNDGYFKSLEELRDYIEEMEPENGDPPEWAFCCTDRPLGLDADSIVESLCDEGYEGMLEQIEGMKELAAAVGEFNSTNSRYLTVYEPDFSRKVKV